MKLKSVIMDEAAVRRSMTRITHEIIEKNNGTADLVLLGIYRRGMPLAAMLRENILRFEGRELPIGSIDISLYLYRKNCTCCYRGYFSLWPSEKYPAGCPD